MAEQNGSQIPEKFQGKSVEDVIRAYQELETLRNQDVERMRPVQQRIKELEPYGGIDGLLDAYGQVYRQLQGFMQNGQQPQQQQPQSAQQPQRAVTQDDAWEQWDYMTPQQQAAFMQQRVAEQVNAQVNAQVQQLYQQAMQQASQTIDQRLRNVQDQWDVYRQAFEGHQSHPDIPMDSMMSEAVRISKMQPNELLGLAAELIANKDGAKVKEAAETQFERYKADWLQEQQNQRLAAAQNGGPVYQNRFLPRGEENGGGEGGSQPESVHKAVMEKFLNDPSSGFTPEHFMG